MIGEYRLILYVVIICIEVFVLICLLVCRWSRETNISQSCKPPLKKCSNTHIVVCCCYHIRWVVVSRSNFFFFVFVFNQMFNFEITNKFILVIFLVGLKRNNQDGLKRMLNYFYQWVKQYNNNQTNVFVKK